MTNRYEKNRAEVLRYLGYKNQEIDPIINGIIDETMEEIEILKKEKHICRFVNIIREDEEYGLEGISLELEGNDIKKHLSKSNRCLLMAVTLGHDVDTKIRYYEKVDMTRALILDAWATTIIEEVCDDLCEEINRDLAINKEKLTFRYSPGYGDLPINIQGNFIEALGAGKAIGLMATSNSILIPRKSVTAIAGVIEEDREIKRISCEECSKYNTCNYRKGDGKCGM